MPKTIVRCSMPDCQDSATHKIAAPWSDGPFMELKEYGHACPGHYEPVLANAQRRRKDYPTAPQEVMGEITLFRFEQGKRDSQLEPA